MKNWCLKDKLTGNIFKILLNREEFDNYVQNNPDIEECINCIECDDPPSNLF